MWMSRGRGRHPPSLPAFARDRRASRRPNSIAFGHSLWCRFPFAPVRGSHVTAPRRGSFAVAKLLRVASGGHDDQVREAVVREFHQRQMRFGGEPAEGSSSTFEVDKKHKLHLSTSDMTFAFRSGWSANLLFFLWWRFRCAKMRTLPGMASATGSSGSVKREVAESSLVGHRGWHRPPDRRGR